jgi:hypothetical protein
MRLERTVIGCHRTSSAIRRGVLTGALIASFYLVACAPPIRNNDSADRQDDDLSQIVQQPSSGVCNGSRWRCYAQIRTDAVTGQGKIFAQANGFGPPDLASAYTLDTGLNPGATIAIVDAYNYPAAESDLANYRSQYGLPACTKANGCLKIVNQSGQTSPLPSNAPAGDDWTVEAALDLDLASAACPNCKLILIEAQDDQGDGLFIAQNAAASLGATVVSNSWGGPDNGYSSSYETYFNHPGMGSFVASGDNGYNQTPDYPSTSAYVTGVGGTSLVKSSNARGWTEGAWSASGSSCSNTIAKPSYQTSSACSKRAAADVSAVGDPNTGLAVYNAKNGGWIVVGGTSASSPFVAGVYALYGIGSAGPSFAYGNAGSFFDITSGKNGNCGTALCNAGAGWDGPTGMGTPNGSALGGGTCTPQCSGKTCGDDGCGGSCGTCQTGYTCTADGQCQAPGCTPDCSGKACGDDGCGGSCGSCSGGATCDSSGQCSGGGGTCDHAICSTGAALDGTCDSCADSICSSDSYCCTTYWDSICVGEVGSVCGQSCGGGTSCAHSICTRGKKLDPSCDSCAGNICAQDSYCCTHRWDSQCVSEVSSICGESCN